MTYTESRIQNTVKVLSSSSLADLRLFLQEKIATILEVTPEEVDLSYSPSELGFDSVNYIELAEVLEQEFSLEITPDILYECHTVNSLAELLNQDLTTEFNSYSVSENSIDPQKEENGNSEPGKQGLAAEQDDADEDKYSTQDIAVIGIGLSLPQAQTPEEFWQLLTEGRSSFSSFPAARLSQEDSAILNSEEFASVLKGGFIDDIEGFDARFFGISPREAELMDPQQRIFLQCVWHALEDAGYRASQLWGSKTAVLVGVSNFDYYELLCRQNTSIEPHLGTGVSHAVLANRISYLLNFKGPSEAIDTACSSSLVAINRAVEALRSGDCDLAIAGGVNIISSLTPYIAFAKAGMLSKTGVCNPFDESANGYVRGEGAGVLLLKSLEKAERDGDRIHAVIKGSAVGHGGRTNSLTAPEPEAQAEVILAACKDAQLCPSTLGYIEAHGTGTNLGDPIEINGLKKIFDISTQDKKTELEWNHNCYLGSVKGNIGHLESAAGIAGLLKVILSLKQGIIPANANFKQLNKYIKLDNFPYEIATEQLAWERLATADGTALPRRAGVSSFGFGGTNAHVVVEEYIEQSRPIVTEIPDHGQLFILSAKTKERLVVYAQKIADFLQGQEAKDAIADKKFLANITHTLRVGREEMPCRLGIIAKSTSGLYQSLRDFVESKKNSSQIFWGDSQYRDAYSELFDYSVAGVGFYQSLAQPKAYPKLLKLWVSGLDIPWESLFPTHPSYSIISLPGYPFARDRYWLPEKQQVREMPKEQLKPAVASLNLLVPTWKKQELITSNISGWQGTIIVLANSQTEPLLNLLRKNHPEVSFIAIVNGEQWQQPAANYYSFAFANSEHRERFKKEVASTIANCTGILDLSALLMDTREQTLSASQQIWGQIALFQELLHQLVMLRQPCRLLQVTQDIQNLNGTANALGGAELIGLFKVLGAEYRQCYAKTIDLESSKSELEDVYRIISHEWQAYDDFTEICYRDENRYVGTLSTLAAENSPQVSQNKQGTVVITGGTGGIGNQVAHHLAAQGHKTIVLMGRNPLPPRVQWDNLSEQNDLVSKKIANILSLEKQGVTVEVYTGDLTNYGALDTYFQEIRRKYGAITKVFHCAGFVASQPPAFIDKPLEQIAATLTPKVQALEVLHRVFEHDSLEDFVLFSSLSSVVPKLAVGISDYGTANAYLNYFAAYQVAQGNSYYRTIQWTNWKEVGMGEVISPAMTKLGLIPLASQEGLQALDRILTLPPNFYSVTCLKIEGETNFEQLSLVSKNQIPSQKQSVNSNNSTTSKIPSTESGDSKTSVVNSLKEIISSELRIAEDQIDINESFENLGVDSIFLASIITRIDRWLGIKLDPSLLLLHASVSKLADYLLETHQNELKSKLETKKKAQLSNAIPKQNTTPEPVASVTSYQEVASQGITLSPSPPAPCSPATSRITSALKPNLVSVVPAVADAGSAKKSDQTKKSQNFPIAVIGVACQFPGAKNKEEFWQNLVSGVDSIQEVPKSRWDSEQYYSPQLVPGKSISKWGGFIDDINPVDPTFLPGSQDKFSAIDPLMRLFYQSSLESIQDAGYTKEQVSGQKIGVFVGARVAGYGDRIEVPQKFSLLGVGQNFIASHVSHHLNLKGPSLVVDTACSSSLMAIHLACQSLWQGDSEMTLAGGVEVLLDEKPYLFLSSAQALSPDGKCFTFDERANGFVPGEGVGSVLLKPLHQALADGDRIYSVIKATATNNDGRTMGVTTPSLEGQVAVIEEALTKAEISPQQISYIETHGTGTMIGDPIELRALSQVFENEISPNNCCGVGSVKTNVGHLLSAAGIASFIKVALSLQHQTIPASLNCQQVNPRFNFTDSPFYPVQQSQPWELTEDNADTRYAGISSFGFGGTNVHLLTSEAPPSAVKPQKLATCTDTAANHSQSILNGHRETAIAITEIESNKNSQTSSVSDKASESNPEIEFKPLLSLEEPSEPDSSLLTLESFEIEHI